MDSYAGWQGVGGRGRVGRRAKWLYFSYTQVLHRRISRCANQSCEQLEFSAPRVFSLETTQGSSIEGRESPPSSSPSTKMLDAVRQDSSRGSCDDSARNRSGRRHHDSRSWPQRVQQNLSFVIIPLKPFIRMVTAIWAWTSTARATLQPLGNLGVWCSWRIRSCLWIVCPRH